MPYDYRNLDLIPFIPIRHGETVQIDREVILPSPTQMKGIRDLVETWGCVEDNKDYTHVEQRLMSMMRRKIPPTVNFELERKKIRGGVVPYAVGIYGSAIGLSHSPGDFYLKGRPALTLAYTRGYNAPTILAHELIHLDQVLATPTIAPTYVERLKQEYGYELEAHHYSARYISAALFNSNPITALWRSTELAKYVAVESVRQKFANPNKPFEPNERSIEELRKIGIEWDVKTY